jgi:hypothetical protein
MAARRQIVLGLLATMQISRDLSAGLSPDARCTSPNRPVVPGVPQNLAGLQGFLLRATTDPGIASSSCDEQPTTISVSKVAHLQGQNPGARI